MRESSMPEKSCTNSEIAAAFNEIADILDLQGDNPFKIRAYRRAAQMIEGLEKPLSQIENPESLPGIGKELAEKIKILSRGGSLPVLDRLRSEVPAGLLDLLRVRGLGPKRVKELHDKLGIKSLEDLERALSEKRLGGLRGFGAKLEEDIRKGLAARREYSRRIRLDTAQEQAEELIDYLKEKAKGKISRIQAAGSLRRRLETIGDLDILVTGKSAHAVMDSFINYPKVKEILAKGDTKSSVVLSSGTQVDLRFLKPQAFGAGLYYFTGSKAHNVATRTLAKQKGLKINEYGVYRGKKRVAGKTEEEIFKVLGLSYIPPELREDRGEIAAAKAGKLPRLVELKDIRGDLHVHSPESDGRSTIEELVDKAKELGYWYLAITDHSRSQRQARGLDPKRLRKHMKNIRKMDSKLGGFKLLAGVEVDILKNGALDLPASLLKELDIVIGAIHSHFNLAEEEQTKRIVKALSSGVIHVFGHPSGRLIGERDPYRFDWGPVIKALRDNNVAVEINASPHRLDANSDTAHMLLSEGLSFAISTDAHHASALREMSFGVDTARRGWLAKRDVINTYPVKNLLERLKR
jgi:DNA polymerase (family 10)